MLDLLEAKLLANRSVEDCGYETPCWIWTKSCDRRGYGQTSMPRTPPYRKLRVHRVAAWVWLEFDIDSPLCVLHHCDVPRCFNPKHLFVGTMSDNTQDMMRKGRHRYVTGRGEQANASRLTEADVREMRAYVAEQGHPLGTFRMLGRRYGVTSSHVAAIVYRKCWTDLGDA